MSFRVLGGDRARATLCVEESPPFLTTFDPLTRRTSRRISSTLTVEITWGTASTVLATKSSIGVGSRSIASSTRRSTSLSVSSSGWRGDDRP
ncbi:MAG TPA: hypothetical protein VJL29_11150 [Thermoguttaceae bacterium]|nr:hypothetical protein [Thermoguttaceae bacterium]